MPVRVKSLLVCAFEKSEVTSVEYQLKNKNGCEQAPRSLLLFH